METVERIKKYNQAIKWGEIDKNNKVQCLIDSFIHEVDGTGENSLFEIWTYTNFTEDQMKELCKNHYNGQPYCIWWGDGALEFMNDTEINSFLDTCGNFEELVD